MARDFPPLLPKGTSGDVLTHDGSRWVAGAASAGGATSRMVYQTVPYPGTQNVNNNIFTAFSYTLPGGTLGPGRALRVKAAVGYSGMNVVKRLILSFGGSVLRDISVTSTMSWRVYETDFVPYDNAAMGTIALVRDWTYTNPTNAAIHGHSIVGVAVDLTVDQPFVVQASINDVANSAMGRLFSVEVIEA